LKKRRKTTVVLVINLVLGQFQTDTTSCLLVGLPLLKPVFFFYIPFELQLRTEFVLYKIWEEVKCQTIDRWKKLGDEKKSSRDRPLRR
jgi:hypothetical protein